MAAARGQEAHEPEPEVVGRSGVSELREARQELAFRAEILANVNDAVVAVDQAYRIAYWNRAAERMYGWSASEVLGRSAFATILAGLREEERAALRHELASTGRWKGERTHRRKDGSLFPVESKVVAVVSADGSASYLSVNREVTERRRAEDALQATSARLRAQFDGVPVPTFVFRRGEDDFVLADYNLAAGEFTRGGIARFLGARAREMYRDEPELPADLERCFATRAPIKRELTHAFRSADLERRLAVTYAFVPPDLVLVHTEDVTERRAAEQELERRSAELAALHDTAVALVEQRLDVDSVLQAIAARAADLVQAPIAFVLSADPGGRSVTHRGGVGVAGLAGVVLPRGIGIGGYVLETGETLVLDDYASWERRHPPFESLGLTAAAGIPLHSGDRVTGVFGVAHTDPERRFAAAELELLERFAHLAALTLENARLYEAARQELAERTAAEESLRRYAERLESLRGIDRAINTAQSSEEVARAALQSIRRLVPGPRASVTLLDDEADELVFLAVDAAWETAFGPGARIPASIIAPIRDTLARREIVTVPNVSADNPRPFVQDLVAGGVRSVILVPLAVEGELVGILNLSTREATGELPREAIEILREMSDHLAIALLHARLREELERSKDELADRVAERTAELSEMNAQLDAFAYSMSHDLRAPLRGMRGFSRALLEDYSDALDEPGREHARRIDAAAAQMDGIISDLLAYNRVAPPSVTSEPVSLGAVVDEALELRAADIDEAGARIDVAGDLPDVVAHRATLVQAIANLVANAVKFVPAATTPRVRVHAEEREGRARLWVEDNGIGIPEAERERIFLPFERLHGIEAFPGTGIGLAVVKRGVERMGGSCGVESSPGLGSRFWIELAQTAGEDLP